MADSEINVGELAACIRARRGTRGLREVATEISKSIGKVSPSTLSRVEQGKVPDLDTFLRLCRWLDRTPDTFAIKPTGKTRHETESNDEVIVAHLRTDRELNPETSEALITMIKLAYKGVRQGQLAKRK